MSYKNIAAKAEGKHIKQEKEQPGRLKMLAGYYKPYKGLFFADLFFAFLGAAVTLVIPLMVRYIMNSISEMSADEAKTMILKIGVGMLVLILVQLGSRYFITYYGHMMGAYIEHDMRNEIFSHYQKLSFAFYDNQKVGQLFPGSQVIFLILQSFSTMDRRIF